MLGAWDRTNGIDFVSLDFADPTVWPAMHERHRRKDLGCPECRSDVHSTLQQHLTRLDFEEKVALVSG